MIKIIKPGTKSTNICLFCGCKYSYEKEDVKTEIPTHCGGADNYYVECPQCNEKNYIQQVKSSFDLL